MQEKSALPVPGFELGLCEKLAADYWLAVLYLRCNDPFLWNETEFLLVFYVYGKACIHAPPTRPLFLNGPEALVPLVLVKPAVQSSVQRVRCMFCTQ